MMVMENTSLDVLFSLNHSIVFYAAGMNLYNVNNIQSKTIHAEVDAAKKLKYTSKTKHINIFVFRTDDKGITCKMAKPCNNCMNSLYKICSQKNYKIKNIYYTDSFGTVSKV